MAAPPGSLFGVMFIGNSYPITDANFVRVDATHWVGSHYPVWGTHGGEGGGSLEALALARDWNAWPQHHTRQSIRPRGGENCKCT